MARSSVQYNAAGVMYTVPFQYIARSHVSVTVDGTPAAFSWDTNTTIRLTLTPREGSIVEIKRTTPSNTLLVDFVDGSVLASLDLDLSALQVLLIAQEALDRAELALSYRSDGAWDFKGRNTTNLPDPVDPTSAVPRQWMLDRLNEAVDEVADKTTFVFVEKDQSASGKRYHIHQQNAPSATWDVVHDLDTFPVPTVYDSDGQFILCSWTYATSNQLRINFAEPMAGVAYVR